MKTGTIAVMLAGIVVVVGIAYSFIHEPGIPAGPEPPVTARPDAAAKVVQVDDLARSPEDYPGVIVLRAVVAGVNRSAGVFGVIDSREFESCGDLGCADNTLPVKFAGDLPEPQTLVEITGRVVRDQSGMVIDATRVEVVR